MNGLIRFLASVSVVIFISCSVEKGNSISLKSDEIKVGGCWYSERSENEMIFNRHLPETKISKSSGYGFKWIQPYVNTPSCAYFSFETKSPLVKLTFEEMEEGVEKKKHQEGGLSIYINDEFVNYSDSLETFLSNPEGQMRKYKIVLPSLWSLKLTGLELEKGYVLEEMEPINQPVYVSIGNSITHGTGQGCASNLCYPYVLAENKGWELYNLAVASAQLGWASALNTKGKKVDFISVLIGFNDWHYTQKTLGHQIKEYNRLIDSLVSYHPKAKVYCISPTHTTVKDGKAPYTLEVYATGIKSLVHQKEQEGKFVHFIDGEQSSGPNCLDEGKDPVHFSVEGAKLFAASLAQQMN